MKRIGKTVVCLVGCLFCFCLTTRAEEVENNVSADILTESHTSDYIYAGEAADAVPGVQRYLLEEYRDSFGQQLDEVASEFYRQMQDKYNVQKQFGSIEFSLPDDRKIQFVVQADDTAAEAEVLDKIESIMSETLSTSFAAFVYDYPQVFWMRGVKATYQYSVLTFEQGTKKKYSVEKININPEFYFDVSKNLIEEFDQGIEKAAMDINTIVDDEDTIYEKAKAIHDWINGQVSYNDEAADGSDPEKYAYAHTAYPVFGAEKEKKVVCEGYAKAFKILCDYFDIPCVLASGMAYTGADSSGEPHMWNIMQMPDGKWYGVDTTWDDSGDGGYDTYFAVGAESPGFNSDFSTEHVLYTRLNDGAKDFVYPPLSKTSYDASAFPNVLLGDINGDGEVDASDLAYMLKYVNERMDNAEVTKVQLVAGDVAKVDGEEEGTVNASDLAKLLRYVNERISSLD